MTDVAWAGIGAIFTALLATASTIFSAKISADKAVEIAILKLDNKNFAQKLEEKTKELAEKIDKLGICDKKIDELEITIAELKGQLKYLNDYVKLLENRQWSGQLPPPKPPTPGPVSQSS